MDLDRLLAYLLFALGGAAVYGLARARRREQQARVAAEAVAGARAESEERLRVTLASIGDAVIATNAAGRVTMLNDIAARLTGWTATEAAGRRLEDVFVIVDEATRRPAANPVARVLREGVIAGLANHTVLIARDGTEVPIDDSAAPIRAADGRIDGAIMVFRDVSERRRAERERTALLDAERAARAAAETAERRATFLAQASTLLASSLDHDTTLARIAQLAVEAVCDLCVINLRDEDGTLRRAATAYVDPARQPLLDRLEARFPIDPAGPHPVAKVLRTGAPDVVAEITDAVLATIATDPEHAALARQLDYRSYMVVPLVARGRTLGAISFVAGPSARRYGAADLPLAEELARRAALAVDNAMLYRAAEDARAAAERGEQRASFLDEATRLLSGSLDYETTLASLTRLAVPALGDWCAIDTVADDDTLKRVAVFHVDPDREALAWDLWRRYPPKPGDPLPRALAARRAELVADIPDSLLVAVAQDDDHLRIVRALGLRSYMIVPIEARGRVLGALTLVTAESGRRYDKRDLALAEDLARRAALAIDNAILYRAAESARATAERGEARASFLAEAGRLLVSSLEYEATLANVARFAVPDLADCCAVDLLDADGQIRRVATVHVDPSKETLARELRERYPFDPDAATGVPRVLRTGQPEFLREIDDALLAQRARDADQLRLFREIGVRSAIIVPLAVHARVLGALTLIRGAAADRYEATDLALAEDLALRAALAIDRARLFGESEVRRQHAEALTAVARSLSATLDPDLLGQRVCQDLRRLLGSEMAVLYRVEASSGDFALVAGEGPAVDWNAVLPRGTATIGLAVRERRPVSTPDVLADPRIALTPEARARMERSGYHAVLAAPLAIGDRIIGALAIGDRIGRVFTSEEVALAQAFADQAALALDNARLYHETEAARAKYQDFVEGLDSIVWEADVERRRFHFVSRRAEAILGYPLARWLGEPGFWSTIVHPDDLDRVVAARETCVAQGRDQDLDYRVAAADGRLVWLRELARVSRDADGRVRRLWGLMIDVTDGKRTEARVHAQHAVTRVLADAATLADSTPKILEAVCETLEWDLGAIWVVDRTANVLRCVDAWRRPTAPVAEFETVTRDSVFPPGVGLPGRVWKTAAPAWIPDVVADDNFPRAPIAARAGLHAAFGFPIAAGPDVGGVIEFFSREIRSPDAELLGMMASIGSQIGQFVERRRAEEERARLLSREQAAREQAERANRAKDDFLAMVSHEIRAPLTSILGWTRMLRTAKLDHAAAARALEVIERNARLQTQLIEDLLDVSRIVSGTLQIDPRSVDLAPVVDAALDAVRPTAEAKNVRLVTEIDPAAGPVAGDPGRLQQAVWNILANAVKFTAAGGQVDIRVDRRGSRARITVADTGRGIAPDLLPYVFDRFRQADAARRDGGLGLGLAIVKHIVELHSGTVEATSPGEGRGATFTITLPVISVHPGRGRAAADDPVSALPGAPATGLDGVRVVVVDDEADARELIAAVLATRGAEVRTAPSAAAAFETIEAWDPHVLVSDLVMPDEDGYALIRRVRARDRERGTYLPAIALTGEGRAGDRSRALLEGFQVHVLKPVDPTELCAAVVGLTGRIRER